MRALLAVAVALAALLVAHAQTNLPPCVPVGERVSATRLSAATVCITINGRMRAAFNPQVDRLSLLHSNGSNTAVPFGSGFYVLNDTWTNNPNLTDFNGSLVITFDVAMGNVRSEQKIYKLIDFDRGFVQNVSTLSVYLAIIQLNNGVPQSITWDEGCYFCNEFDPKQCFYNVMNFDTSDNATDKGLILEDNFYRSCGSDYDTCQTDPTSCDLKVYVLWTGTDSKGTLLSSANLRFSRFRQFGIGNMFGAAREAVNNGVVNAEGLVKRADDRIPLPFENPDE